jgi:hypothetical protein
LNFNYEIKPQEFTPVWNQVTVVVHDLNTRSILINGEVLPSETMNEGIKAITFSLIQ